MSNTTQLPYRIDELWPETDSTWRLGGSNKSRGVALKTLDESEYFDTALYDVLKDLSSRHDAALSYAKTFEPAEPVEPIPAEIKIGYLAERIGAHVGKCPESFIHGWDVLGHHYGKELYCGREWCPVCGKKDSAAHLRRFARWMSGKDGENNTFYKLQSMSHIGYFVIEWPLESRDKLRSRRAMERYAYGSLIGQRLITKGRRKGKFQTLRAPDGIKGVLNGSFEVFGRRQDGQVLRKRDVSRIKAKYFDKAESRWHYHGDVMQEIKHLGLKWSLDSSARESILSSQVKSNIHLNVLVDYGFVPPPFLEYLKRSLRIAFNEPRLIVHYGYLQPDKKEVDEAKRRAKYASQAVHLLKYVTRATFLDYHWDVKLAGQLYGFRNGSTWGCWHAERLAAWSLEDLGADGKVKEGVAGLDIEAINSIGQSKCPKDGLPLQWGRRPQSMILLRTIEDKRDLGGGFWQFPDIPLPMLPIREGQSAYWHRLLATVTRKAISAETDTALLAKMYARIESERSFTEPVAEYVWRDGQYVKAGDEERRADWLEISRATPPDAKQKGCCDSTHEGSRRVGARPCPLQRCCDSTHEGSRLAQVALKGSLLTTGECSERSAKQLGLDLPRQAMRTASGGVGQ